MKQYPIVMDSMLYRRNIVPLASDSAGPEGKDK